MIAARLAVLACACLAACLALCGRADAITELCPATLTALHPAPPATVTTAAAAYTYELRALTPRTVNATIVADTDAGWFGWSVAGVPLRAAMVAVPGSISPRAARSGTLAVSFPSAVTIRHAWVSTAAAPGEAIFAWDAAGNFPCDVPAFSGPADPPAAPETNPPAPAAAPPARAAPVAAPVQAACAAPFVAPTVTAGARPTLPRDAFAPGDNPAAVVVDVALDANGKQFDAWVVATAGAVPGFDESALRAVRLSEFRGAVSYCKPVKSVYVFRLDFQSS